MELRDASFSELYGTPRLATKPPHEGSGLERWFHRIYQVHFSQFTAEDLARACRQKRFPEYIIPWSLRRLSEQPLAGELYEGELFDSLRSSPIEVWHQHPEWLDVLQMLFDTNKETLLDALGEHDFERLRLFILALH